MAELVVKSNALIQASYTLGLVEQRLILMSIVQARESGEGITAESILVIRAQDYASLFNVTKQTAYQALADAVETLFNRRATVDVFDKKRNLIRPMAVRWVTAMAYEEHEGLISLRFGHEVVPEITRLEENFTSYELEQVAGLKSAYAVRLYELLIQWRTAGKTPVFEINQFRSQLGLGVNEYPVMGDFKKRVLDYAVKQINDHTDIKASYEQMKTGRTITGFSFKFKQKITATKAVTEQVRPLLKNIAALTGI
jgi:plasmid replication initiation protein